MDRLKQWIALAVVGMLAVLAAGWVLLVSPKRSDAADLWAQAADQQRSNSQLKNQLGVLEAQAQALPQEQSKLAAIGTKLPDNPAQPALLRALSAAADTAGVDLISVAPGQLEAGTAAVGAATPTLAATGGNAGTLQAMPLTITVAGGYFEAEQYIAALEDLPRALRVTGLTVAPGANPAQANSSSTSLEDGAHLMTTITGFAYVASGAAPLTPVVAPAATVTK